MLDALLVAVHLVALLVLARELVVAEVEVHHVRGLVEQARGLLAHGALEAALWREVLQKEVAILIDGGGQLLV